MSKFQKMPEFDISKESILSSVQTLKCYPQDAWETPLIQNVQQRLVNKNLPSIKNLMLKLDNMQGTGSFKVRGVINQFAHLSKEDRSGRRTFVTMSAGNYGKAFAHVAKLHGIPAVVFMPETAPANRRAIIQSLGAAVKLCPSSELMTEVRNHQERTGSLFLHSFDDPVLIAGHASAGYELTQSIPEPDVVLVCCGGGGFLAGVATAMRTFGWKNTRIYGVEPENACTMHESLKVGRPVEMLVGPTIAAGLAPPFAGKHCFALVQQHVNGICLVSDSEIKEAIGVLFHLGLVVEPSGAAAFAALWHGKVADVEDKNVVVFVTGGNVSPAELVELIGEDEVGMQGL